MKASLCSAVVATVLSLALVNCTVKAKGGPAIRPPIAPGAPQAPAPAQKTFSLASGDYKPSAGNLKACPQNIGTAKMGDVVIQLYVTLMSPCSGATVLFECENGSVCRGGGAVLTIQSERSYEYRAAEGWTATYSL